MFDCKILFTVLHTFTFSLDIKDSKMGHLPVDS